MGGALHQGLRAPSRPPKYGTCHIAFASLHQDAVRLGLMRACAQVMLNAGAVGDPRAMPGMRGPGPSMGSGSGGGGKSGEGPSGARSR